MPSALSATIDQLRQQLHDANEQYHHARREWEKWLDASEFRHEERIDSAREKLQKAEHAVEETEAQIQQALRGEPPAAKPN
jgi:predicted  nucleic acid-binding Zn-ribbon protein